jgi:PHD/YefM family antitoxin component YafN of YafNO toxin-antitoxin module
MEAHYIVDENGKRVSVVLPVEEYERMVEALEDLEDLRAYDEAKAEIEREGSDAVPWEQLREEIGSEYEKPEAGESQGRAQT